MRIITLDQAAELGSMSRRNLEKLIADGTGPAVVKLSARRVGIVEDDWRTWLLARRRTSPGQIDAEKVLRGFEASHLITGSLETPIAKAA